MKVNVCCVYWILLSISFVSSCLLFILVAAESGVIDSSVKTVDYNDTVDTEILAKNSETLEKYSGQQKENVYLIRNEKDRSKVFGDIHQESEHAAEIHSSFEDVVSLNNVESSQSVDTASYSMSPESVPDVTTEATAEDRQAMERPVCSLKQLTTPPARFASCDGHEVLHWSRRASFRLLQVTLLYVTVTWIAWAFPPLYDRLFEAGQGVVFSLADMVSAELQDHASSSSHQHTEGLLMENRSSSLGTVTLPLETQIVRPQISDDESLPNNEETSKNLSILEDAVDDRIFKEKDRQYVVRAEPKIIEVKPQVHIEKPEGMLVETDAVFIPESAAATNDSREVAEVGKGDDLKVASTDGSEQASASEDIPSFSEWAQKQLAEAEKKKTQNSTTPPTGNPSRSSGNLKIRSKNYASPDCGAKIVATNPEAMYAGSIISPSRDEYVLNACANRFWFVVELCEAIQAKKIDLANFELFSSSPRDFSVWLSDRFPSRDWRSVGHFTAQDERDIQSFSLDPHLFGKFIKVELHSHYGSEHYCPISLFRVYGTSEFEVLETEVEVHESVPDVADDDDNDEEHLDLDTGEPPKTLFGSAQDAVMSIVKKAAQALVKGGDSQNSTTTDVEVKPHSDATEHENCASPSHIVVCDNCSDAMYNKVFGLLSCQWTYLQSFVDSAFVRNSFQNSKLCAEYGLDFSYHRTGAPYPLLPSASGVDSLRSSHSRYLSALLPSHYIAALCNVLAVLEKKVVLNVSYEINGTTSINLTSSLEEKSLNAESYVGNLVITHPSTHALGPSLTSQQCSSGLSDSCDTLSVSTSSLPLESLSAETTLTSQIKPTKTLAKEPDVKEDFPSSATMKTDYDQIKKSTVCPEISPVQELPSGMSSTVTVSVCPGEENRTGTQGNLKDSVEVEAETPVHDSVLVKVEMTGEPPMFTDVDQQQAGVNERQSDMIFEEKYYQENQDSLSLDSFLSELKDVDMGLDTSSSSAVTPATVTTTTVLPQTQQVQKESVFVRLSNRIKALERNMSLSGQYLEELSRRYKKQVEEMQRAFNRTLAALAEESHKGNEREQKRIVEMTALQKQLATLTVTVDMLLLERDSWQHKAAVITQYVAFIIIEVIIFGIILYFCLPLADTSFVSARRKWSFGWHVQKANDSKAAPNCQRSVEAVSGHEAPKTSNCRPSVEALNVSGAYSDLVESHTLTIVDGTGTVPKTESRRRRRKRKDALHKSSSSANLGSKIRRRVSEHVSGLVESVRTEDVGVPTRRASSSELGNWWSFSNGAASDDDGALVDEQSVTAPAVTKHNGHYSTIHCQDALPVTISASASGREFSSVEEKIDLSQEINVKVEGLNVRTKDKSKGNTPLLHQGNGSVKSTELSPKVQCVSPPIFMKTAMSARSNRIGRGLEPIAQARLKSDNWEWYSSHHSSSMSSDKSNQGMVSPTASSATLHSGGAHSANGPSESEEWDRTSKARECQCAGVSQRNSVKKMGGSSGLKKMVKKFF